MATLSVSVSATELAGLLNDTNLMGSWEEDGCIHLYWEHSHWKPEIEQNIQAALDQLRPTRQTHPITIQEIPWENWNAQWTQQVKPIWIGTRLIIRPIWETVSLTPGCLELIIDPKQAFGTGHHATTFLLLEWLTNLIKGGERVLDVGTGSGILAMVAIRFGAQSAVGIDNDPIAITCAKDYALTNHFSQELTLQVMQLEDVTVEPFDLILANLDCRTLLSTAHQFSRFCHPHTTLLVSGLLQDGAEDIQRIFEQYRFNLEEKKEHEEWLALGFTQK